MITVSAPNKVHLTSAHIVVYGKPAILCSLDLRVYATIAKEENRGKIHIKSNYSNCDLTTTSKEIIAYTNSAKNNWESFIKTNNLELIKSLTKPENFIKIIIGETLLYLKKDLSGVLIDVNSKAPVGVNLGSSAAVSAAVSGAIFRYFKKNLDKDEIYKIVYETEKRAHGNPSGGDPAIIIYGGLLWFRKETEFIKLFKTLQFPNFPKFLLVNSQKPEESTAEMVFLVKKLVTARPKYAYKIFNKMEELKKKFIIAVAKNDIGETISIMRQDVKYLFKLGVVSEKTKKIIKDLEDLGSGISVSGACGRKNGSGVLVVLNKDNKKIINYFKNTNLDYYQADFQVEGVREENE